MLLANMDIKQLNHQNIKQIIDLESHSAPNVPHYKPYDEEALKFIFDNSKSCRAYGMFDGEKLIGWGAYRTNWSEYNKEEGVYEISSIVIDKDYRRKGYGQQILDRIISEIKSNQSFNKIYLTVSPLNNGALILYLENNFVVYDYKKDIYGPGADRIFLEIKK